MTSIIFSIEHYNEAYYENWTRKPANGTAYNCGHDSSKPDAIFHRQASSRDLECLLRQNRTDDPRFIVGSGIGADAAVIDTGGLRYPIARTDPITFTADQIGWYAVHINA